MGSFFAMVLFGHVLVVVFFFMTRFCGALAFCHLFIVLFVERVKFR